jgi:hypothetical protein
VNESTNKSEVHGGEDVSVKKVSDESLHTTVVPPIVDEAQAVHGDPVPDRRSSLAVDEPRRSTWREQLSEQFNSYVDDLRPAPCSLPKSAFMRGKSTPPLPGQKTPPAAVSTFVVLMLLRTHIYRVNPGRPGTVLCVQLVAAVG